MTTKENFPDAASPASGEQATPAAAQDMKQDSTAKFGMPHISIAFDPTPAQKRTVLCILLGALLFALSLLLPVPVWVEYTLLIFAAAIAGLDVFLRAFRAAAERRFDERQIVSITAVLAFFIGKPTDGAAVVLLFQIGLITVQWLYERICSSVLDMTGLEIDEAVVIRNGVETLIHPADVTRDDLLIIRPGCKVPVDCSLEEGKSVLNLSALTGDNTPYEVHESDFIPSGAVNVTSELRARPVADIKNSTASILWEKLVAEDNMPKLSKERAHGYAKILTIVSVAAALMTALLVPVLAKAAVTDGLYRALSVLLVACPGVFLLSVYPTYFAGICGAMRKGVLFTDASSLERLARMGTAVFDKNTSLVTGNLRVAGVQSGKMSADMFLKIAAHAEAYSEHPIAKAIISAYGGPIYIELIQNFREFPGKGIAVIVEHTPIILGTEELLREAGIQVEHGSRNERAIYMAIHGQYAGRLVLGDKLMDHAKEMVQDLKDTGIERIVLLDDDEVGTCAASAEALGIYEYYSACSAEDKVEHLQKLYANREKGETLAYINDGISNPDAMHIADIPVAMHCMQHVKRVKNAKLLILGESPALLSEAVHYAKNTHTVFRQHQLVAAAIQAILLLMSVAGMMPMWIVELLEVTLTAAIVSLSMRAYTPKK